MNWKSTIVLVVLAGASAAWFFMGDAWKPSLGLNPAHPEPPPSVAAQSLDALTPADITSIKITFPSGDPLEVSRANAQSPWTMPGNWPPRPVEVQELADTLGHLRARFHPEKLPENGDLTSFGLAAEQKPIAVTVKYKKADAEGTLQLAFGEPPIPEGETSFTRPGYVRVSIKKADGTEHSEILKVGPDVLPVVKRSADSYRRRQLFPSIERVKIAGGGPAPSPFGPPGGDTPTTITLPGEDTEIIAISRTAPTVLGFNLSDAFTFTLKRVGKLPEPGILTKGSEPALRPDRLADAWRLAAPADDNADPERLRSVLAAVSDLWVDEFVHPAPDEAKLGFGADSRTVRVKVKGSEPVTVRFGAVARTGEREETITVPGGPPGTPPRTITNKVPVEYRYARVDGNPQVFVVAAEKLGDIFLSAASMADSRVARFDAGEVVEVDYRFGNVAGKLIRKEGNPRASKPEERQERWFIDAKPNPLLADTERVNEFLDRLAGLRSDSPTSPNAATPADMGKVTVVAREKRAEGEPSAPARMYQISFKKPEAAKLVVALEGRPRLLAIDDHLGPDDPNSWIAARLFPETLSAFLARPPITYRNRKLFDTAEAKLSAVAVAGGFTLKNETDGWRLTAPVNSEADAAKSATLTQSLSELRATEYLTDAPTPAELASFGLDKPSHTATLTFDNGRTYTLDIGRARPGKPEVFARLDRGAVFGLPTPASEPFAAGAIGLLPLKVWSVQPEKVTSVQITRFGDAAKESFSLAKEGTNWKLTGPFTAPVPFLSAQPLLTALGNLTAESYKSLSSANAAEFGFDKPLLSVKIAYTGKKPGAMEEVPTTNTVIVGGTTPDGLNRYAKLDMPNAPVFVVPAGFVFVATTAPLSLPDKALLALDQAKVASIRVAAGKPENTFSLTKDATGKWTAQGATFAIDPVRIAELIANVSRPQVGRLAAYGDAIKWADYGLEKPETTVTITLAGEKPETHTISLGNPDPSGARFARIDDKPAVAVLPSLTAETLSRKRFDYADRTLLKFDPATVTAITRTKDKEELELMPGVAAGWDITKPTKQKADQLFVDELADTLGRLRAERVAAYGKKEEVFKQYGLEPGAAVVTLTVGDKGEQKTLRIGNPVDAAKPNGERYAAVDSAAPEIIVGVLPAALVSKLLSPTVAFRDRTLANFVDADKVVIERGDRKVTFTKSGATWKLTEPVMADAEAAALADLLADLGGLRVDGWVGEKAKDAKEFGLDKPDAKWTVFNGDKAMLVLSLGKKTADGRIHAMADNKDLIGLLTPAMSARLLAEYRQRKVWDVDAAQAEEVDISIGAAKFAFVKAGAQWLDPAKPTDTVDAKAVNDLIGTLGTLRVERYAADKDADTKLFGLEKPEAVIAVQTRTGAKAVLELGGTVGGTDGKQRYARVADKNRTDVFILSADDTAKLTRDRVSYLLKK